MDKLNYELVGKKETIECFMTGEIPFDELDDFYFIDLSCGEEVILPLRETYTGSVLEAINNPNILFVQKSK